MTRRLLTAFVPMLNEYWRPVVRFEGCYEVSNFGRVKSLLVFGMPRSTPIVLIHKRNTKDYPFVRLFKLKRSVNVFVHRIVLEAFVGPCPPHFQCAHLDGNRLNPRVENLRWTSAKENHSHKALHGTLRRGETAPSAKLTEADIPQIRSLTAKYLQREIASMFGVTESSISRLLSGKTWKHNIGGPRS